MKQNRDWMERLVAVGMVVVGCMFKQYIITIIGIAYFIAKI